MEQNVVIKINEALRKEYFCLPPGTLNDQRYLTDFQKLLFFENLLKNEDFQNKFKCKLNADNLRRILKKEDIYSLKSGMNINHILNLNLLNYNNDFFHLFQDITSATRNIIQRSRGYNLIYKYSKIKIINDFMLDIIINSGVAYAQGNYILSYVSLVPCIEAFIREWYILEKNSNTRHYSKLKEFIKTKASELPVGHNMKFCTDFLNLFLEQFFSDEDKGDALLSRHILLHRLKHIPLTEITKGVDRLFLILDIISELYLILRLNYFQNLINKNKEELMQKEKQELHEYIVYKTYNKSLEEFLVKKYQDLLLKNDNILNPFIYNIFLYHTEKCEELQHNLYDKLHKLYTDFKEEKLKQSILSPKEYSMEDIKKNYGKFGFKI